ncbi:(d)CMP kinase [Desulfofustis glycolicus]|uniref:Cytidylate kinase n=1 Tax=Desulfofustis glycolicus DSM 9705 TaxID=1121409 RepID=A0A1M5WKQ7_9BACT|nr:(d)CMP kinase [Desulfofustis glycolicus]MCB2217144.1 (d)CMP kinase [Desulfobulbaceae bacterium]SHH88028.1 cytidylate kinase [Desulfofustis glycolicus DSM 9705]
MPEPPVEVITIDGPAGVGKSTISRKLAARLGYTYLDTGAMYRAAALSLANRGIDCSDEHAVVGALSGVTIELLPAADENDDTDVLLNGERVGALIRTPEMSMRASTVSAVPAVRCILTEMQREIGRRGKIVAEGRDTGTVVFPGARHKFFLDADSVVRARRRALQMRERGETVDEKTLLEMTVRRDRQDSERAVAPLKKADDAWVIDTSTRSIDQVLEAILAVVRSDE